MSSPENSNDYMAPENWRFPSDFAGQSLFQVASDWHNNAMLGWTYSAPDVYAVGYKDAADGLLYALSERRVSLDTVIYPLVFLYRQGLELQLKLILPLARRLANKAQKNDHSHGLMPMWGELRELLDVLDPYEDDKEIPAMQEFIRQLDEVDPQSYAFRYSTTKRGEVSLPDIRHINVRHLSEIMDSVFLMMSGIRSVLENMDQEDSDSGY